MRLNKFISETGVCSRRQADDWIAAGRVTVNGVVATRRYAPGDIVASTTADPVLRVVDPRRLDVIAPARTRLATAGDGRVAFTPRLTRT